MQVLVLSVNIDSGVSGRDGFFYSGLIFDGLSFCLMIYSKKPPRRAVIDLIRKGLRLFW